jgi:hypothetical protein
MSMSNNEDYTKTDINGIPARYVLTRDTSDPTGATAIIVKVIDIDTDTSTKIRNQRPPILNPLYNFNDTPLHLQDQSKLITQHRLGDHSLPYRVINPDYYTKEEMDWYVTGRIPTQPMSICMTYAKKCYLCGDFQENQEDMRFESSGRHPFGYKFCKDCEPYFRRDMYRRLGLSCIWEIRVMYEEWCKFWQSPNSPDPTSAPASIPGRPVIWVNRTRRDENGERDIVSKRPYRYTKWKIACWVPRKFEMLHYDESTQKVINTEEYGLIVEQIDDEPEVSVMVGESYTIRKVVPLYDILVINFDVSNTDTTDINNPKYKLKNLATYNPNEDDPLNKYTYAEKIEMMRKARKIEMP